MKLNLIPYKKEMEVMENDKKIKKPVFNLKKVEMRKAIYKCTERKNKEATCKLWSSA